MPHTQRERSSGGIENTNAMPTESNAEMRQATRALQSERSSYVSLLWLCSLRAARMPT